MGGQSAGLVAEDVGPGRPRAPGPGTAEQSTTTWAVAAEMDLPQFWSLEVGGHGVGRAGSSRS